MPSNARPTSRSRAASTAPGRPTSRNGSRGWRRDMKMKQANLALPLSGTLALVVVVVAGLTGSADEKAERPTVKKPGTLDLLMVETTPVVFKDRLYRFE